MKTPGLRGFLRVNLSFARFTVHRATPSCLSNSCLFSYWLNSNHCPRHCAILNNFYWLFWQLPLEKRLITLGRLGVRSNKVKFWDLSFPRLPKVQKGRFLSIVHWENSTSHLKWLPNRLFLLWRWAVGFEKTPAPGTRKTKTRKLKCNKNRYFAQK